MKYVLILVILSTSFCLKAKKSPFDVSKPSLGMFGFILTSLNRTSTSSDTTPPTVTVTNLKSKGTIETGLLIGTASDNVGVASVEVQINSGSYAAATVTGAIAATWTYTLPPKLTWVASNYNKINIRVKDAAGNQTISALANLLKAPNQDFNGDGYADLIVSTPTFSTNFGKLYIFNGSSSGVNFTLASSATKTITGSSGDKLGNSFTVGDFNGDGYPDLGVCAFVTNASTSNKAFLYYGSSSGLNTSSGITIPLVNSTSNEFCYLMASGDFNGDGYDDLAIADRGGSELYIYNGGTSSISTTPTRTATGGSNMGNAIDVADIDGNGYSDIAISSIATNQVHIFNGSSTSIPTSPNLNITLSVSNAANAVKLNDVTGDGKIDLIVGITADSSNVGKALVYSGTGNTINTSVAYTLTGGGGGGAGICKFGNSLFISDVNEDGVLDILIGAFQYNNGGSNNGKIHLFSGGSSLTTGLADTVNTGYVYGETANPNWSSQFGSFISVRDVNADGVKDLIVGASAFTSSKGAAYIFLNASTAFTSTLATSNTKIIVGEATNDAFGTNGL